MIRLLFTTCVVLVLAGCHPVPASTTENSPAVLALSGEPIRFLDQAEPLDVDHPPGDELALMEALRRAIQHDSSIQMALARVRQAQADAKQVRLLPNPIVDVALRYPESGGDPVIEASIAADLLSLLKRPREIRAADHALQASSADALTSVLDTAAAVQTQYLLAQSLGSELALLDKRRELSVELVGLAESRLRAGEGSQLDLLAVQSQVAALENESVEKAGDLRVARLTLARMIGRPSDEADWTLEAWRAPSLPSATELDWINLALENRAEIQARAWELEALGEQAGAARLAVLDDASVGAAAERDGEWTVGPSLSIPLPLFDFGQARRAKLGARRVEARHQLNQSRRHVVQEVRTALVSLSAAQNALSSLETTLLPLEEKRRAQAQDAYRLGLADITSVRLAEQEFQSSRSRQIELQRKVAQSYIQLQRAVGGGAVLPSTTRPSH